MARAEVLRFDDTRPSVTAWLPRGYDGRMHYRALLGAIAPAAGILAAAALFLFAIL